MAGLGMLMLLLGVMALWLRYKKRVYSSRPFLWFALLMGPSGLIAILAGWVTTEVGRQPWVVYGLQRTKDAVSAHGDLHMSVSLLAFFVVYTSVFGVGYSYMVRLIKKARSRTNLSPPSPMDVLHARFLPSLLNIRSSHNGYRSFHYLVCDHRLCHADVYRDGRL
jgi:cytochrome bd-type quinol oxidase subunit 1